MTLPGDGTLLLNLRGQAALVDITAPPVVALEASEVIAWLATACRASPSPSEMYSCKPTVFGNSESDVCSLEFVTQDTEAQLLQHKDACWRKLFRNPVIADGYPICARSPGEKGLQMSLQMMMLLGQTPWVTTFEGTTMLKGFNSLFAPTACLGSSTVWHFLLHQDETRVTYNQGLDATSGACTIDNETLQSDRHFVGWTPAADVLAGEFAFNQD